MSLKEKQYETYCFKLLLHTVRHLFRLYFTYFVTRNCCFCRTTGVLPVTWVRTLFLSCSLSLHLGDSQSMLTHLTQMLPSCSTQKLDLLSFTFIPALSHTICLHKENTYLSRRYILFINARAVNVLEKSVCRNFKAN